MAVDTTFDERSWAAGQTSVVVAVAVAVAAEEEEGSLHRAGWAVVNVEEEEEDNTVPRLVEQQVVTQKVEEQSAVGLYSCLNISIAFDLNN